MTSRDPHICDCSPQLKRLVEKSVILLSTVEPQSLQSNNHPVPCGMETFYVRLIINLTQLLNSTEIMEFQYTIVTPIFQ